MLDGLIKVPEAVNLYLPQGEYAKSEVEEFCLRYHYIIYNLTFIL